MELRIAFIGMGNVAKAFARMLHDRRQMLAGIYGISWRVIGISTGRHGSVISSLGIDLPSALAVLESGDQLTELPNCRSVAGALEIVDASEADIIFETTPLNAVSAEPATSFIRSALQRGTSVVTANKGPVAFAYRELSQVAESHNAYFRFEGTVMDGAPVFNLTEYCLPGTKVLGFSGVLNSTTNLILTGMESGREFQDCLKEAQAMGIAEAEPDYDIDGWDATVKAVALANVLMGAELSPRDVKPEGIRRLTTADLMDARKSGQTYRLVSRAISTAHNVQVRVSPERIAGDSLFASMRGTDNALIIETDLMKEIAIVERAPEVQQTAYALLSDMIRVHETLQRRKPRQARGERP